MHGFSGKTAPGEIQNKELEGEPYVCTLNSAASPQAAQKKT